MSDDNLVIEVWDFDPAETIREKVSKFLDIKGVRGFRKMMKELAVTASTGKHDNELIGRCSIPLRVSYKLQSQNIIRTRCKFPNKLQICFLFSADNFNIWLMHVVQFG